MKREHRFEIFIDIQDPYSYLLLQALVEFRTHYFSHLKSVFHFYPVNSRDIEAFPELVLWKANAFDDACYLAERYGFDFPANEPMRSDGEVRCAQAALFKAENSLTACLAVFRHFWQEEAELDSGSLDCYSLLDARLKTNNHYLNRRGHYMGGMLYYAGEWYWGVDRLAHLERRLIELKGLNIQALFDKSGLAFKDFKERKAKVCEHLSPLTLYFSIRSPYSHLGLEQAVRVSEHYGVNLVVKPVLPMVMRGLSVPSKKKLYIFHDTKREAMKLGIRYGFVADPLGKGVEHCYALFDYACRQGREVEYLLAYSRAVNTLGVNSQSLSGLKKIVQMAGLDWQEAKTELNSEVWRDWAKLNLEELYALGLWGVPSFSYKECQVWGQDRLVRIEDEILEDIKRAEQT
ncbi:DsbA family protein [Shewanella woodyi]|uniref:DsbA family protein n=1 Tax=Shewanella woodyi TaxID=60961 RepID=UPI0000E7F526|nr:DsbA family protein [Shewanella woodyi]